MCSTPKMPEIKNVIPQAPSQPEAPPKAVEVAKDGGSKAKRRANPLRIDLAAGGSGASSGVNV